MEPGNNGCQTDSEVDVVEPPEESGLHSNRVVSPRYLCIAENRVSVVGIIIMGLGFDPKYLHSSRKMGSLL